MREKESGISNLTPSSIFWYDPEFIAITDGKIFRDPSMFDPNDYIDAYKIWSEDNLLEKDVQKESNKNYHKS